MTFTFTTQRSARRLEVAIAGDIDLAAYPSLQAQASAWASEGSDIVLDCSQVTFMDSMGLRLLVELMQAMNDTGGDFALTEPSRPVKRVLELAGVQDLFQPATARSVRR